MPAVLLDLAPDLGNLTATPGLWYPGQRYFNTKTKLWMGNRDGAEVVIMDDTKFPVCRFQQGKGWYALPLSGSTSTITQALNQYQATAWYLKAGLGILNVGFEVTTLGAAGAVMRCGVWDDCVMPGGPTTGPGLPGLLLAEFGTIATTSTGGKTVFANGWVVPQSGYYWIGCVPQGATCVTRGSVPQEQGNGAPAGLTNATSTTIGGAAWSNAPTGALTNWGSSAAIGSATTRMAIQL